MKVLVTGGAGFIGSHLVDALMKLNTEVVVLDNLSAGRYENVQRWIKKAKFSFIQGDMRRKKVIINAIRGCDQVFHFAANLEARMGQLSPQVSFDNNTLATFNLLEAMRQNGEAQHLVYASSCTVYGDAKTLPTPEDYSPILPISVYAASKMACENLISSYVYTYGLSASIYRLGNVIGPRLGHGAIKDFIEKLRKNSRKLEILGDGAQTKSYLYIADCIDAIASTWNKAGENLTIFNLASEDRIDVKTVAHIVITEMGLRDVELVFNMATDDGRGWKGDVKHTHLAIDKLKSMGWKPRYCSSEAVRLTCRSLIEEYQHFART